MPCGLGLNKRPASVALTGLGVDRRQYGGRKSVGIRRRKPDDGEEARLIGGRETRIVVDICGIAPASTMAVGIAISVPIRGDAVMRETAAVAVIGPAVAAMRVVSMHVSNVMLPG